MFFNYDTDDTYNDTLVVLSYAGVDVVGRDGTVTVNVRRPHCSRQRTCRFTSDRRLVNHSDAVVFNDMTPSHKFPAHRTPQQKWILRTMEVQSFTSIGL